MAKKGKLTKLYLLVITVPKGKKEIIGDMLEDFDVTGYLHTLAKGSFDKNLTKDVMFCIIKEYQIKDAMLKLEDKFGTFRSKVSMAYTVPLSSVIGVSSYIALSNGGKHSGR